MDYLFIQTSLKSEHPLMVKLCSVARDSRVKNTTASETSLFISTGNFSTSCCFILESFVDVKSIFLL